MAFDGFGAGTTKFLRDIAKHNDKAWFEEHRDVYERDLIEPARELVEALGPALQKLSPGIQAVPKVGGSIMRFHRDIRFSKDKSPYKTHLDLWFWEGEKKGWDRSGFFFRLQPRKLMLGTGMHAFDKPMLAAYRHAVVEDASGKALLKAIRKAEKAGATLSEPELKRVPRGFDPEHPRAHLLRHKGLTAGIEEKIPEELRSKKLVRWCVKRWRPLLPLHAWLLGVAEAK